MTKLRVQVDVLLLIVFVIFIGATLSFSFLYKGYSFFVDNLLDVLGLFLILKGVLIRMSARGHKKANSDGSHELVTTGLYKIVRNPMYLGTFYIGSGFVFMLLPWWMVFIFAGVFYWRFNIQMRKEEKFLTDKFGKTYEEYCRRVPRIIPNVKLAWIMPINELMNPQEMFSTKEKRGLWSWPLLALSCEIGKEYFLFHGLNLVSNLIIFCGAYLLFMVIYAVIVLVKRG